MSDIAVNEDFQRPLLPATACTKAIGISISTSQSWYWKGIVMTHRLVVPSAFVELLLAEHTTATLLFTRLGL
mgnify:FL=1|jgi:hypothetical protein